MQAAKVMSIFLLGINFKMPTTVGILKFMTRTNFTLSSAEHEKSFITSGPGLSTGWLHMIVLKK